jgi:hypothetical protein
MVHAVAGLGEGNPERSPQQPVSLRRRLSGLEWLAIIPIVVAMPFLFFGLVWTEWPQALVGLALLALGAGLWILFAPDD